MPAAATRNSPTVQISTAQLGLAVLVQIVVVSLAVGGLFQRVAAQERMTEPLARGDLAKLEERSRHIEEHVVWIRQRLEREEAR